MLRACNSLFLQVRDSTVCWQKNRAEPRASWGPIEATALGSGEAIRQEPREERIGNTVERGDAAGARHNAIRSVRQHRAAIADDFGRQIQRNTLAAVKTFRQGDQDPAAGRRHFPGRNAAAETFAATH